MGCPGGELRCKNYFKRLPPLWAATIVLMESAPARVLGIDHGQRRIGVALSDALGVTVQPLMTLQHTTLRQDVRSVARLCRRYTCSDVVLGWPIHMSGDKSSRAADVERFAEALREQIQIPVHLWDERLTTAEAHRHLEAAGRSVRDRKEVIDQVAAMLILESWLQARRATPPPPDGD
jgi:putative Holliday junction resolvase